MSGKVVDKDLGWNEIIGNLEKADGKTTKVGVVGPPGRRKLPSGLTVASVAAVHEFGSSDGRIPERSFIRAAVDDNQDAIVDSFIALGEGIYDLEPEDLKQALEGIGAQVTGYIQAKIRDGLEPPLKPETVEENGGETRPLAVWLSEAQTIEHEEGGGEDT